MSRAVLVSRRLLLALGTGWPALAQSQTPDDFRADTDAPRLFLRPQRLRRLRRERERQAARWEQFARLYAGKAAFPEPVLAHALMAQATEDAAAAQTAARHARQSPGDLRSIALALDWGAEYLDESARSALASRALQLLEATRAAADLPTIRSRVLAAMALAESHTPLSRATLHAALAAWWPGYARRLQSGAATVPRHELPALMELLHVVRDNLQLDLREQARAWFARQPPYHVLSYYPPSYPAAENEYHIPALLHLPPRPGEPDLNAAAQARVADLMLTAYDTTATEVQFVQGWVMNDRFNLQGAGGSPYELLWANPYQPGLTYQKLPLAFHDPDGGRLFLRSSWDEDAAWFGQEGSRRELCRDGQVQPVTTATLRQPLRIGEHLVVWAAATSRLTLPAEETTSCFLLGLEPNATYQIEVDDQEVEEARADRAGTLAFHPARRTSTGVRWRKLTS